jgi:hypothetical protein
MSIRPGSVPPGEALLIHSLVTPTEQGIASRVLARTAGGNLTLFAFDTGQELSGHTAPFDAMVLAGLTTINLHRMSQVFASSLPAAPRRRGQTTLPRARRSRQGFSRRSEAQPR